MQILGKEYNECISRWFSRFTKRYIRCWKYRWKNGTLSTFTKVDKGEKKKDEEYRSKGGIIYQLEGSLLVASTRDMQTHPDKTVVEDFTILFSRYKR